MTVLFTARHESNDFSEYTASSTDGGDLSISAAAALAGSSYGMSVLVDDVTPIYAYKLLGSAVTTGIVRYRFYLDTNSITMDNDTGHAVINITNNTGTRVISFAQLHKTVGGSYSIYVVCRNDSGVDLNSTITTMTDAPHWIEVETKRATNSTSTDGYSKYWIDDTYGGTTVGTDNFDYMVDYQLILLGAISGMDASTSGTYYLDELVVNDDGAYIGPVATPDPLSVSINPDTTLVTGVRIYPQ